MCKFWSVCISPSFRHRWCLFCTFQFWVRPILFLHLRVIFVLSETRYGRKKCCHFVSLPSNESQGTTFDNPCWLHKIHQFDLRSNNALRVPSNTCYRPSIISAHHMIVSHLQLLFFRRVLQQGALSWSKICLTLKDMLRLHLVFI